MIKIEGSDIGLIDASNINSEENCKKELVLLELDIVVNLKNSVLKTSFVEELYNYQKEKNRCIVFILPVEQQINYPENWDFVPTKAEALDFIFLERMQRDLGF